jgi:hypothetical protein
MARKRSKPKHVFGKSTGYTLNPDDSVDVCPMYRESMDDSMAEEDAIRRQLEIVTAITTERLKACQKARRAFWDRVVDDLGIDPEKKWKYHNGRIFLAAETNDNATND